MSSVLTARPELSPIPPTNSPRIPRRGDLIDLSTLVDEHNRPLANRKFLVTALEIEDKAETPFGVQRIARTPEVKLGRWQLTYFNGYRGRKVCAFLDRPGDVLLQVGIYDRHERCPVEMLGQAYPQTQEGQAALAEACRELQRAQEGRHLGRLACGVFAVDAGDDWDDDDVISLTPDFA